MTPQKATAGGLRTWLLHVISVEQRPNFEHIIVNWRRWRHEVTR